MRDGLALNIRTCVAVCEMKIFGSLGKMVYNLYKFLVFMKK